MQKCPRCSREYDESAKICRTCGAILETVVESPPVEPPPPPPPPPPPAPPPVRSESSWSCPACRKAVPGDFDVCWNCGGSRDGVPDPTFVPEPPGGTAPAQPPATKRDPRRRSCAKCGSTKVIPRVQVLDQGEHSDRHLQVILCDNPDALFFKGRQYGELRADICGQCGYVEWHVDNPAELYEHYRRGAR